MLFLHETHKVVGAREDEFEAAYREGWMPTLAAGEGERMPRGLKRLDPLRIQLVQDWIAAGAPATGFVSAVGCH